MSLLLTFQISSVFITELSTENIFYRNAAGLSDDKTVVEVEEMEIAGKMACHS